MVTNSTCMQRECKKRERNVAWYPGTSQFSHIAVDLGTGGKRQGSKMQLGSPRTCISTSFIDKQHLLLVVT